MGFKINKDGKIEIAISRQLTKRQLLTVKQLTDRGREAYVLSLAGITRTRVDNVRYLRNESQVSQRDQLARKESGLVASAFRHLLDTSADHRPSENAKGQWIGVEIECFIPLDSDLARSECECEFDDDGECISECRSCRGDDDQAERRARRELASCIRAAKIARCSVKDDGSLSDENGYPCEVTLLLNTAHGFETLERLCILLNQYGCYVNKTCGMHVHLDMRHVGRAEAKAFAKRIGDALPIIKLMVPESRRNNTYCKLGVSGMRGCRYFAVNLLSLERHGTIEVRLHSSTTHFQKIKNWVLILRQIMQAPRVSAYSFQSFIDSTSMPDTLVEYIERRIAQFGGGLPDETPETPVVTVSASLSTENEVA